MCIIVEDCCTRYSSLFQKHESFPGEVATIFFVELTTRELYSSLGSSTKAIWSWLVFTVTSSRLSYESKSLNVVASSRGSTDCCSTCCPMAVLVCCTVQSVGFSPAEGKRGSFGWELSCFESDHDARSSWRNGRIDHERKIQARNVFSSSYDVTEYVPAFPSLSQILSSNYFIIKFLWSRFTCIVCGSLPANELVLSDNVKILKREISGTCVHELAWISW